MSRINCKFAQVRSAQRLPVLIIRHQMRLTMRPIAKTKPFVYETKRPSRTLHSNDSASWRLFSTTIRAPFWCKDYVQTISPCRQWPPRQRKTNKNRTTAPSATTKFLFPGYYLFVLLHFGRLKTIVLRHATVSDSISAATSHNTRFVSFCYVRGSKQKK